VSTKPTNLLAKQVNSKHRHTNIVCCIYVMSNTAIEKYIVKEHNTRWTSYMVRS